MNTLKILGIKIFDRIKEAGMAQLVLSKYSDIIRTRIGFHELNETVCSRIGYLLLELCGNENRWAELIVDLKSIGGLDLKEMFFDVNNKKITTEIDTNENETQIRVLGILIDKQQDNSKNFQYILTKYGCSIKLRVGINFDTEKGQAGVILLELVGDTRETLALQKEIIENIKVEIQKIVFD